MRRWAYRGGVSSSPRSPLALAALATVAIPGLDVVATRPPRQTSDDFDVASLMDSTGRRWTVRAPRTAVAGAAIAIEADVLTGLARMVDEGHLDFEVPRPAGFATLPEGGRAMVHRELRGSAFEVQRLTETLARRLGTMLAAIHDLDPAVVADAGLPVYDAQAYRARRLSELDEAARTGHVPTGLLRRWEHALEDVRLWKFTATPVHGDLVAEHILVADDEIAAVVHWADARVADPADDLAWLIAAAAPEIGEVILESYRQARAGRADEFLAARTLLASELALPRWLMHGVRTRTSDIIDDAIDMLTDLDRAVADAEPIGQVPPVSTDWVTGPVPIPGPEQDVPDDDEQPWAARGEQPVAADDDAPGYDDDGTGYDDSPGYDDDDVAREQHISDYPRADIDEPTIEGGIAVRSADAGHDPAEEVAVEDLDEDLIEPDYDRSTGRGEDDSPTTQFPSV